MMGRRTVLLLPAGIVLAAILACVAALLVVVSREAEAAFPGDNGDIVYVKNTDGEGNFDLFAKSPGDDNSEEVQLTFSGSVDDPSYTADGERIIYTAFDPLGGGDFEVYAIPATGGSPQQLTHNDAFDEFSPSLSPDGDTLVFWSSPGSGGPATIYTVPVSGGTPKPIVSGLVPEWSPDGERILFCSGGQDSGVYTVPASGGNPNFVANGCEPEWSPGGERIAYIDFNADTGFLTIYTIPVSGGTPQPVYESETSISDLAYSPDGHYIAFWDGGGNEEINIVPVGGGDAEQFTDTRFGAFSPDWQPLPGPPEKPLRVSSVTPAHRATGVARDTNLSATFSEEVDPATINDEMFRLLKVNPDGTKTPIADVVVSCDDPCRTATLNPYGESSTLLGRFARYKAIVRQGVRDPAGNQLDQNPRLRGAQKKVWYFKTGST
jgi:dipeptidyl aminopeptidase/acylaminoacyl peptidase